MEFSHQILQCFAHLQFQEHPSPLRGHLDELGEIEAGGDLAGDPLVRAVPPRGQDPPGWTLLGGWGSTFGPHFRLVDHNFYNLE